MLLKTLISVDELNRIKDDENMVILDSRFYLTDHGKGRREYDQGHVPNATFVDLHHDLAGEETELTGRHPLPSEKAFSDCLKRWGVKQDSLVVVYDDMNGAIAARAWWMLAQQGIDVRVLEGGIPAWLGAGFPLSTKERVPSATQEAIDVAFPWAVEERQVVENMETGIFQMIDARAQDRFHGENENIDPVAGHIPGAINRPFGDNLMSDGRFKSPEQLKEEWLAVLQSQDCALVHSCGSGVTACHNVLALNHAGIESNNVYVGSWSQWSKRMMRAAGI